MCCGLPEIAQGLFFGSSATTTMIIITIMIIAIIIPHIVLLSRSSFVPGAVVDPPAAVVVPPAAVVVPPAAVVVPPVVVLSSVVVTSAVVVSSSVVVSSPFAAAQGKRALPSDNRTSTASSAIMAVFFTVQFLQWIFEVFLGVRRGRIPAGNNTVRYEESCGTQDLLLPCVKDIM